MTRAERRRDDRQRPKGKLTDYEADALEQQRKVRNSPTGQGDASESSDAEADAFNRQIAQLNEMTSEDLRAALRLMHVLARISTALASSPEPAAPGGQAGAEAATFHQLNAQFNKMAPEELRAALLLMHAMARISTGKAPSPELAPPVERAGAGAAGPEQQLGQRAGPPQPDRPHADGQLTEEQFAALEKLRREREGSEYRKLRAVFLELLAVVRRSGILPYLERQLRKHPGPKSRFPIEALVVMSLFNWYINANYQRVAIYKLLEALDPQSAFDLGLCTRTEWVHITINIVYKQYQRLEHALEKVLEKQPGGEVELGWKDEQDGTHCSPKWLMDKLVNASVPRQVRRRCKNFAVDETDFETFARIINFEKQKDAEARGEMPSKDKHAKLGHRTQTQKKQGEKYCGFKLASLLAMPEAKWTGDAARKPAYGYRPPPFALAAALTPANANAGLTAIKIILKAEQARLAEQTGDIKKAAAQIKRVMADRGISDKAEFVAELLKLNIRPIIDYKSNQISRPDTIQVEGRVGRTHTVVTQAGGIYPYWMPADLLVPAPREDKRSKPGPYTNRAKWRYSLHRIDLEAQTAIFICPVHAGRLTYPGSPITPNKSALEVEGPGPGKPCCDGPVHIPFDKLNQFQDIPWGTIAWRSLYRHYRAVMEGLHGGIKKRGGLNAESCRVFDIAAHTIAATAALVVWNVKLAIRYGLEFDDPAPQDTADTDAADTNSDTASPQQRPPP